GHRDDLAGVRRIGQDLLVSGHRRIETHLAVVCPVRAEGGAGVDRAVLQSQFAGPLFHHLTNADNRGAAGKGDAFRGKGFPQERVRERILARADVTPLYVTPTDNSSSILNSQLFALCATPSNRACPIRTIVAPSSIATSKSLLMPIDSSRNSGPATPSPRISS